MGEQSTAARLASDMAHSVVLPFALPIVQPLPPVPLLPVAAASYAMVSPVRSVAASVAHVTALIAGLSATAVVDTMANARGPSPPRRAASSSVLPEQRKRTPPASHVHATSSVCARQQQRAHTLEAHSLQRTRTCCSTHASPRTHSSARRLYCPSPPPPRRPTSSSRCSSTVGGEVEGVAATEGGGVRGRLP
ncbi:unnamed protein product [Closterium sp. NIES-64]|nr:unnamed protein product [Closterium sp. NIES-64]